jgi:hypothetical protein
MAEQSSIPLSSLVGDANALVFEHKESIPNGLYLELMNLTGKMYPKVATLEQSIETLKVSLAIEKQNHNETQMYFEMLEKENELLKNKLVAPADTKVKKERKKVICKKCYNCGGRLKAGAIAAQINTHARKAWEESTDDIDRYNVEWLCEWCM